MISRSKWQSYINAKQIADARLQSFLRQVITEHFKLHYTNEYDIEVNPDGAIIIYYNHDVVFDGTLEELENTSKEDFMNQII